MTGCCIPSPTRRHQRKVLHVGLPGSPGAASGQAGLRHRRSQDWGEGTACILVRTETSPEDIHGMHAARGILTKRGGMTSHAAVVARGMGVPACTGTGSIRVDDRAGEFSIGDITVKRGDIITIDGVDRRGDPG